ncbi:MAG TPA: Smr/MutS family protein [Thermoanaerobaculia bacterium]|nr:Smr/MutS family protein [Thermoanaerobaculia bacterium]
MSHSELDWPGALRLAGRFCATGRGRDRLSGAVPSPDAFEVVRRLGVTRDLVLRRALRPPVPLGGLDEGAPLVSRLGPHGRAFAPEDLLDLFLLAERAEGARAAVPVPDLELPHLADLLFPLASFEDLLSEREPTFEPDGRVKDTASARLYAIRSSIQRLRKEVVRKLEEVARTHPDALTGGYVTEKGGRYCLPVRTDRRELVGGLLHERSGSGQTIFVEPLAVVEDNNALAEAVEEEREEVHRILVALTARFSSRREELLAAVEVLTELDAYQARAEFSSRVAGVFPDFSDRLVLKGARHPLLDRRLADLRADVFGELEERHADAVPLDLELPEGSRLLLLSGPNAGGKSVAMKTVGLFALLAQSGFAIPASTGSTLPVFDKVLVVAGDAQDLLGDLSSFAAAMTRTARVLAEATPRSLVLVDELGSGTDPDEGAALAIAVLEEDLRRGGVAVATTHLSAVKEWAQEKPGVLSAAMEFDEKAGRPTFRVRPGASGRSRALAVAEKAGLPARVLSAAKKRLGAKWEAADAALTRLETETRRAREEADNAQRATREAAARLSDLEKERAQLASDRARLKEKAKGEIDRALSMLREKVRQELERMREDLKAGRSISRGALMTVTQSAREAALSLFGGDEEPPHEAGPVAVGMEVRVASLGTSGRLLALDAGRGEAEVEVKGKRLRVAAASLSPAPAGRAVPLRTPALASSRAANPPTPSSGVVATAEVVLVGLRVDEALPVVEKAINDALLSGKAALRLVHGHGTGRLAAAVREFLQTHPGVASYRWGDAQEGGQAVTIARLDV